MGRGDGETRTEWDGDVLGRKQYADFLTPYLVRKTLDNDGNATRSFAMALDADWGEGKTYFVGRWAKDLEALDQPHLTLIFDAWAEDYSADPLIAFLASFQAALERGVERLPPTEQAAKEVKDAVDSMVKRVRRAFVPTLKVVGKGLLSKAIGAGVDEVLAAVHGDSDSSAESLQPAANDMSVVDAGLDAYFADLLEEQRGRGQVITEFRQSVERTLAQLHAEGACALPMFVFVDELDRCRPSFAIALLEAIKHIFGVAGVCFVVSTNMRQLSNSVRAVYGADFDGRAYLRRFFDVEYDLPAPDRIRYIELLLSDFPEITRPRLELGFPHGGFTDESKSPTAVDALEWVVATFDIDLRSQRQFLEMFSAAAQGIPKDKPLHLLWLAILCAIRRKAPGAFTELSEAADRADSAAFDGVWKAAAPEGLHVTKTIVTDTGAGWSRKQISLHDIAVIYYRAAITDLKKTRDDAYNLRSQSYPAVLLQRIAVEAPNPYDPGATYPCSLAQYFMLVRHAGHIGEKLAQSAD